MNRCNLFVTLAGFCLIMESCVGWSIWEDSIGVERVISGNTIQLENGVNVVLLGLEDTRNSQERLQELLCPNDGETHQVWFIKDSSYPELFYLDEDNNTFYAYVSTADGNGGEVALNGLILREGRSRLCENPYLRDSLGRYQQYVDASNLEELILPNPVVKPVLDPEVKDIVENQDDGNRKREIRDHSGDRWLTNGSQNCDMLRRAVDYTNSVTKSFANLLAAESEGPFNVGQICEIYSYLRKKWKYVNDPADNEYVAYASESIQESHLSGDCDDFAILMAACMLAIGGEVCINTAQNGNEGHAFTEIDVSRFQQSDVENSVQSYFGKYTRIPSPLSYRREGNHVWLNLDWQTTFPGGNYWLEQHYTSWDSYVRESGNWLWKKLK